MAMSFKCTEDALEFGARASAEELAALGAEKIRLDAQVDAYFKAGRLQQALNLACASQFCREAIEAAGREMVN